MIFKKEHDTIYKKKHTFTIECIDIAENERIWTQGRPLSENRPVSWLESTPKSYM